MVGYGSGCGGGIGFRRNDAAIVLVLFILLVIILFL
jgi:hypothetical protein